MTMTPDEHTAAIRSLQSDVADIKGTLNNDLHAMVQDQRPPERDEKAACRVGTRRIGPGPDELLAGNPAGLLLIRDELIGWLRSFDRDGHEGDRKFFLEVWNETGRFTYERKPADGHAFAFFQETLITGADRGPNPCSQASFAASPRRNGHTRQKSPVIARLRFGLVPLGRPARPGSLPGVAGLRRQSATPRIPVSPSGTTSQASPGTTARRCHGRRKESDDNLSSADIILLLVSASFIASAYCWSASRCCSSAACASTAAPSAS